MSFRKRSSISAPALFGAVTAFFGAATLASVAISQDSALPTLGGGGAGTPPPGWVSRCESTGRGAPLECRIEQRAVLAETGQLVVAVAIRVPGQSREPALSVRLPLGLSIDAGVALDVDGSGRRSLPLQTCDGGGCYAGAPLADDLLDALIRGNKLDVVFRNLNDEPIRVAMSLAGFADAFARIK